MKIAILGTGNTGMASAIDLTLKGHQVTLIKTSSNNLGPRLTELKENGNRAVLHENGEKEATIHQVTADLSAVADAEVVLVYIQTNFHEKLIERLGEYISDHTTILMNPGYLSTCYAIKAIQNPTVTFVEATSSFIDCRLVSPTVVDVSFRNVINPVGVYPSERTEEVLKKLEPLQYNLVPLRSVLEAALHNPNLIVHTVGAIMSIPRIEYTDGDYCMYGEVFTPSVWKILKALDHEKMDTLEKLGFERVAYEEACKVRNRPYDTRGAKEIFYWYATRDDVVDGPHTVNTRYIMEDVPEGLVLLESLGAHIGVATPVATSLIEIASAALATDFRKNGRTVERLGIEALEKILEDNPT